MGIRAKTLMVTALLIGGSVLITGSASAQSVNIKPGWGFGDTNHVHVGPPGQSVLPQRTTYFLDISRQLRDELNQLHTLFACLGAAKEDSNSAVSFVS